MKITNNSNIPQVFVDIVKEDCVGGDYIETRLGTDKKCEEYCDVKRWCPYWKARK